MATRMQQRRGLAAQWTAANPVLAAGEIGFETDTNKFKMGNGTSTWSSLVYFANATELTAAIQSVVGMAPETLNTLSEISDALGDDPNFLSALATNARVDGVILQGASNLTDARNYLVNALSTHEADTTSIHGIADTSLLATTGHVSTAKSEAITEAASSADVKVSTAVAALTKSSVGLGNVNNTSDADKPLSTAQASAIEESEASAVLQSTNEAESKVSLHSSITQGVHGIADTALLALKSEVETAKDEAIDAAALASESYTDGAVLDAVGALTKSSVGLDSVDNTADASKPVSTAQALAIDNAKAEAITDAATAADEKVSDHNLDTTNVHGIADTAFLVTQDDLTNAINGATVDPAEQAGTGLDYDSVAGEFNIDSTVATKTYANDAVSTHNDDTTNVHGIADTSALATKTYVDTAATNAVQAVVAAAPAAFDTLKEIADYISADQTAASAVTASLATKAPLASPTFTGTVTLPAAGIVFSDGTQSKVGVPSVTTIGTARSASETLSAGEQDKFVPLSGAVVITLPATGYSTGQSIDFYQATGTGASFANTNGVVGTPGLKFRTTNSVATAMKISSGWLVFGDLSA